MRLSELLRSPVWGNDMVVRLEEVWDTLPANLQYPLTGRERFTPLYASADSIDGTDFHPLLTLHVDDILDRVVDDGGRTALDEFLQSYPGAAGYEEFARRRTGDGAEPDYVRHNPNADWLYMHWKMPAETGTKEERLERLSAMTRKTRRASLLLSHRRGPAT
ncbi:hypothetical protein ACWGSB_31175 [Streptomyces albidoflavus]